MTAAKLAELLGVVQQREAWFDGHCPAHNDTHPSFSFADGPDGLVVLCRAGCEPASIIAALTKQFPASNFRFATRQRKRKRHIVATYQYRDEDGQLLSEVVRYEPKDFRQRRPDGKGGWIWNMDGVRRVLYRLSDLKNHKIIWVVEGERDADRLWNLKLPATTNSGGAGQWHDDYTQQLVAQGVESVIIIPDNDEPGERHARAVARACFRAGLTVVILRPPGLRDKGDISDWLQPGHTGQDLLLLIREAELVETEPPAEESGNGGHAPDVVELFKAKGLYLRELPDA